MIGDLKLQKKVFFSPFNRMHLVIRPRQRLPTPRPNLLIIEKERYPFREWRKKMMVYRSTDDSFVRVVTRKLSDMRFVKRIELVRPDQSVHILPKIDAYRVDK